MFSCRHLRVRKLKALKEIRRPTSNWKATPSNHLRILHARFIQEWSSGTCRHTAAFHFLNFWLPAMLNVDENEAPIQEMRYWCCVLGARCIIISCLGCNNLTHRKFCSPLEWLYRTVHIPCLLGLTLLSDCRTPMHKFTNLERLIYSTTIHYAWSPYCTWRCGRFGAFVFVLVAGSLVHFDQPPDELQFPEFERKYASTIGFHQASSRSRDCVWTAAINGRLLASGCTAL